MTTIGEVISRLRNSIKAVSQDALLTDRFLYSLLKRPAAMLMRRQDSANKIMKFNSVFQALDYVELIEVDRVQAGCRGIYSGCTFKRTREKIPALTEGYFGPLLRAVTSLDISQECTPTYPSAWERMFSQKTFKYNKAKYYWYLDGYLYFPNVDWEAVRVEGVFENDVSRFNCDPSDDCLPLQETRFNVPEFLFVEIEQQALQALGLTLQIPTDTGKDNRSVAA